MRATWVLYPYPWWTVFACIAGFAFGIWSILAGLRDFPVKGFASVWVVFYIGVLFLLAGFVMTFFLERSMRWRRNVVSGRARYPTEPWRWDYPWERSGSKSHPYGQTMLALSVALGFATILVPGGYELFRIQFPPPPFFAKVVFAALSLAGIGIFVVGIRLYAQARRVGQGHLEFAWFPFRKGSDLSVIYQNPVRLSKTRMFDVEIRALVQQAVISGTGKHRRVVQVAYVAYQAECRVNLGDAATQQMVAVPIQWKLPREGPATELASFQPTYWEVVITGVGNDSFPERFLVPVY